jgi:hypothetical protein
LGHNDLIIRSPLLSHVAVSGDSFIPDDKALSNAADCGWDESVDRKCLLCQDSFNNGDDIRAWLNALRQDGAR